MRKFLRLVAYFFIAAIIGYISHSVSNSWVGGWWGGCSCFFIYDLLDNLIDKK